MTTRENIKLSSMLFMIRTQESASRIGSATYEVISAVKNNKWSSFMVAFCAPSAPFYLANAYSLFMNGTILFGNNKPLLMGADAAAACTTVYGLFNGIIAARYVIKIIENQKLLRR